MPIRSPFANTMIPLCLAALALGCPSDEPSDSGAETGGSGSADPTSATAPTSGQDSTGGQMTESDSSANEPPPTPTLATPADGAEEVPIVSELCWNPVEDPDGDAVRYRVWIDDIELTEGKLGEPGYAGPCMGPLNFNYQQEYSWQVSAFEVDNPDNESARADAFKFTTEFDISGQVVFEDNFNDDLGWTVEGDALTGAWERGNPVPTVDGGSDAQPDDCGGGMDCYFTGQNPMAVVTNEDVSGGSTSLISPEFDLGGFATASVTLSRWFYKSGSETGTQLQIELLVPDADEPDGFQHHVLEHLESAADVAGANAWMPVEYAACSVPMRNGSRLRITATDLGSGIVEAAIDTVEVMGMNSDSLCSGGEGAICNPDAPDACSADFLCCPQGVVNKNIFRCSTPVAALDYDNPTPNKAAPYNGPMGCDAPDIFVDEGNIGGFIDVINVANNPANPYYCALLEGCLSGVGSRRILRFNTTTPNAGSRDVTMGVPANHPDLFNFAECHGHHHFDGYAQYRLLDSDDNVVASGHKQAFCLIDISSWAWPFEFGTYNCGNQGISVGFEDTYGAGLDCQWIDITDVPSGTYNLEIAVNPPRADTATPPLVERDYSNNVSVVSVTI